MSRVKILLFLMSVGAWMGVLLFLVVWLAIGIWEANAPEEEG